MTARERANPQSTRRSQERVHHTASTLFSGSRDSNAECSYCQQPHSPTSCSSVTDVASRKQILKTSGRCYNCLRRNHVSRDCKSSSRCQKCKRKHHSSICDANYSQPRLTSICDSSSRQPKSLANRIGSGLDPGAAPYQLSTTSSNLCSDNLHTASTLFSGSRDSNAECSYCQQPHSPTSCSSVTDVASRKQILKTSGRCYNCLRRNHVSRDCKSSSRCQKCKRKHHTSICDANCSQPRHTSIRDSSSSQPKSLANPVGSGLDPGAAPYQPSTTSSNLCSDNLRAVFLQTARAVIHNPSNSHVSLEVRLLLDSGSNSSREAERDTRRSVPNARRICHARW